MIERTRISRSWRGAGLLMVLPATATMTFAGTAGHVQTAAFGRVNGEAVEVFTLTNAAGIELRVMTYGAAR